MKLAIDFLGVSAEVWMMYYLYEHLLVRQPITRWKKCLVYVITGILFMTISTFIPQPRVRTVFSVLTVFLPIFLYQSKWFVCMLTGLIYASVQAVTEMAVKAALLSIYGDMVLSHYALGVLLSKTLAFFVIHLIISLFRIRAHTLSLKLFFFLLILPLSSMIIIYLAIDMSYLIDTPTAYLRLMSVCLLLIGATIMICYLFEHIVETENIRQKNALAKFYLHLQQKQYTQLIAQQENIQQMYHDVKRHLNVLGQYIQDNHPDQALDYIEQQEIILSQEQLIITGYSLLDGILSAKKDLAQQHHIDWQCQAHISSPLSTFPEADITVMLDNALDNAIEATSQLSNSDERWITINIKQVQNSLHIVIRNSTKHKPITQRENLKTTKADPINHGLGINSIRQLAKKHNGTIQYACDGQVFTLQIMVNISNNDVRDNQTAFASKP